MLKHWSRLNRQPSNEDHRKSEVQAIRSTLQLEWADTLPTVEWDVRAARAIIDMLLPTTPAWLDDNCGNAPGRLQGIHQERYWFRALNETIDAEEITDQAVARDIRKWCDSPSEDSQLIASLCGAVGHYTFGDRLRRSITLDQAMPGSTDDYCAVWERLARQYWGSSGVQLLRPTPQVDSKAKQFLLLSQQVLSRTCKNLGSATSGDELGIVAVLNVCQGCVPATSDSHEWLKDRTTDAMSVSLMLVNKLLSRSTSLYSGFLRPEDRDIVRRHVVESAQRLLFNGQQLRKVLNPDNPGAIYDLVFDPGPDHRHAVPIGLEHWKWLGPVLLDALKEGDPTVALEVCQLVSEGRPPGSDNRYQIALSSFQTFFGNDAPAVIRLLNGTGCLNGDIAAEDAPPVSDPRVDRT